MLIAMFLACAPEVTATPDSTSAFGNIEVSFDLSKARVDPAEVLSASVGGVPAWGLKAQGDTLSLWVQGHPVGGDVPLTLVTAEEELEFPGAFHYEPNQVKLDPVVVLGASIGLGVQDGVPSRDAQLNSPGAIIARQIGAYMPLPLLIDPLFVPMTLDDFGPAPGCEPPSRTDLAAVSLSAALEILGDDPDPALARVSPELQSHNLAVNGATVSQLLYGVTEDDPVELLMGHIVMDPDGQGFAPMPFSQLEVAESLGAEVLLSFDLLGNDVLDPVLLSSELDITLATDLDDLEDDLADLFYRLDDLGAEVFFATTPDPTWLPMAAERAQALRDAGVSEEEIQSRLDAISAHTQAANNLLREQASLRAYAHIVDLYGLFGQIRAGTYPVAGASVSLDQFGGILSLDGFHLSDTGNALVADVFIGALSVALGEEFSRPDLATILATDPNSREALAARGYSVEACSP